MLSAASSFAQSDFGDYSVFSSANSTLDTRVRMGALVDSEASAITNATATGDDLNNQDDEDGVTVPATLIRGQTASIVVNVTNTRGGTSYLNAWIDFNRNGSLTDTGERIASNLTVANGTSNANRTISFTVPAGASLGTAGIRVRFTSTTTSSPTGSVGRGEVEDYITTISDPITLDYGDFSGFGIASSTANTALRMGSNVDAEASAHNNSTATGDDSAGVDDEDGITGPTSIARDENVTVTATVTNTTAAAAHLNAWIDFNRNGVLTDAGEQIAANVLVAAGTTNSARNITFTVPSGASIGTAGVRFRLTSTMTPGSTGQSGIGEVEDYTVNITTAPHVAIGNMVYIDANQDNWYNWGEGVGGVIVQLMNASHAVVATTTTSTVDPGYYLFNNVVPGNYYVRIPASEFASGKPLHGKLNVPGWNINHRFDEGGVGGDDGIDSQFPATFGIRSLLRAYQPGTLPTNGTSEWGVWQDRDDVNPGDANGDLTVDFGFIDPPTGTYYLALRDLNKDSTLDLHGSGESVPDIFEAWRFFDYNSAVGFMDNCEFSYNADTKLLSFNFTISQRVGKRADIITLLLTPAPEPKNNQVGALLYMDVFNRNSPNLTVYRYDAALGENSWTTGQMMGSAAMGAPYSITATEAGSVLSVRVTMDCTQLNDTNAWPSLMLDPSTWTGVSFDRLAGVWLHWTDLLSAPTYNASGQFSTLPYDTTQPYQDVNSWLDTGAEGPFRTKTATHDFSDFSSFASASSQVRAGLRIGNLVDAEPVGNFHWQALGDDLNGADDEDGVTVPASVPRGLASSLTVNVTNTTGASAFLNAWIDFNRNGTFDTGEQIATNTTIANGTSNSNRTINFTTPSGASLGTAGVRVRLTSTSSPGPASVSGFGEVEDYITEIINTPSLDFGDWSGAALASSNVNSNLRLGWLIDSEATATTNTTATGDNITGQNDEDGVQFPTIRRGWDPRIIFLATNQTGANAFLNVWMDFDGNGTFADSERVMTNIVVPTGISNHYRGFNVTIPTSAQLGSMGVRVRLNNVNVTNPSPIGAVGTGEVEDYVVQVLDQVGPSLLGNWSFEDGYPFRPTDISGSAVPSWQGSVSAGDQTYNTWGSGNWNAWALAHGTGFGYLSTSLGTTTQMHQTVPAVAGASYQLVYEDGMYNPTLNVGFVALQYLNSSGTVISGQSVQNTTTHAIYSLGSPQFSAPRVLNLGPAPSNAASVRVLVSHTRNDSNYDSTKIDAAVLTATLPPRDFGDFASFATASSNVNATLRIGATTDSETTATTNTTATGDDITGSDDEDGVTLPPNFIPGVASSLVVNVTNTSGSTAFLNVWIDYNRNGSFDAGEQIATNTTIATGTSNSNRTINFTPPLTASVGHAGVRVRLTSTSSPGPTGHSGNGEVEDHMAYIGDCQADVVFLLDQSGSIDGTEWANMTASVHGIIDRVLASNTTNRIAVVNYAGDGFNTSLNPQIWIENDFTSNVATAKAFQWRATAWQAPGTLFGGDDAHGAVSLVGRALDGTADSLSGLVSPLKRLTPVPDRPLVVFLFTDAVRSGGSSYLVNPTSPGVGTNEAFQEFTTFKTLRGATFVAVIVPVDATGTAPAAAIASAGGSYTGAIESYPADPDGPGALPRRLTTSTNFALTSAQLDEIARNICDAADGTDPVSDYGDFSLFGSASSRVIPNLRIGATTDAEFAAVTNSSATGDDTYGSDDEDGVTGPTNIAAGTSYTATVNVTNTTGATAFLNVWIDFNGNGVLTDAGERIASNVTIAAGTNNSNRTINFTVPVTAVPGPVGVRARLTSVSTGLPTDPVGNGEVEDYVITVDPSYTIGNLVFNDNNRNGRFDAGDTGVSGVTLQLFGRWDTARSTVLQTTTTASNGSYTFTNVPAGDYYVHLPASNFLSGGPLFGRVSSAGAGGNAGTPDFYSSDDLDDNANENGQDSHAPLITGIDSWGIRLGGGSEPSATNTEIGFNASSDNANDGFGNLTIDFGFIIPETLPCPQHLLVLCGTDKGMDSLAFDHGLIGYLVAKGYQVTPALPDWAGLRDPASGTLLTVALTDFDGIVASATAHNTFLDNRGNITVNLNALARPVLMLDGLAARFLGIGTAATVGWWRGSAWVENNSLPILPAGLPNGNVDLNNAPIGPAGPTGADKKVVFSRNPGPGAQVGLWDVDQPSSNNGFLYALYPAGAPLDNGINAPATRVFYGITENGAGLYSPQIDLAATSTNHFTAAGKNLLDKSIELAFASICLVNDFGDHSGIGSASSRVVPSLRMGAQVDIDAIPVSDLAATGDDLNGIDDEDGVTFPTQLTPGNTHAITVNVTNTTGSTAFLNVWIDFNGNGVLTDAGERIASNVTIANGSNNSNRSVTFTVPASATPGSAALRVRLTSVSTSSSTGLVGNGEVEDYVVQIGTPTHDFGDAAGLASASAPVSSNLFLGNGPPDAEFSPALNVTATGDDLNGIDDEDGVDLPPAISPGTEVSIPVAVTNRTSSNAFLTAWIDFNHDGILNNAPISSGGELLEPTRIIPPAPFEQIVEIVFTVPTAASIGSQRVVRFRIANGGTAAPTGVSGAGEVEDYLIDITPPTRDFGDAPSSYGVASHLFVPRRGLGVLNDTEIASIHNATAHGDDASGIDDEDGVFFNQPLIPGREASVIISTAGSGYVNLWIDWNRDGDFADAGEQMITNTRIPPIKPGFTPLQGIPVILTFTVPPTASLGASFARARFTTNLWTGGPTGAAPSGEVEDHAITIQPASSIGGRLWADTNQNGIRDGSEPGVPGIPVLLLRENGQVEDYTTANAAGDYLFTAIPAGNYRVELGLAPGQHTLSPADQGSDDALDSEFNPTTRLSNLITLSPAASNLRVDAAIRGVTDSLGRVIRITHSALLPISVTDWTHDAVLPKFDPALGTLTQVTPHLAGLLRFHLFAENRAPNAGALSLTGNATYDLTIPNSPVQQDVTPLSHSISFAAFDGSYDYHNASGLNGWDLERSHRWFYPTASSQADFIATSPGQTVTLTTGLTLNTSISTSGGNLPMRPDFKAGHIASVTYTFDLPQDHGDFSGFASATSTVVPNLRLGALTDAETNATLNTSATGDDITDLDDEDGVLVPTNIIPGVASSMIVNVTNTSGAAAFLNAWIDFNGDGLLNNTEERIATNIIITNGSSNANRTLNFTPPLSLTPGQVGVRVRLTSASTSNATGFVGNGEVEDYTVNILAALPPTQVQSYALLDNGLPNSANPLTGSNFNLYSNIRWTDGSTLNVPMDVTLNAGGGVIFRSTWPMGDAQDPAYVTEFGNDQAIPFLYLGPSTGGTASATFTLQRPVLGADVILYDIDENDVLSVVIKDELGNEITDRSAWRIMTGDLTTWNNPPAAALPVWDAATGTVTATASVNENRSYIVISPNVAISEVTVTFGPTTGSGRHAYVALHGDYLGPRLELGNLVWADNNNNGQRDVGEQGLADVSVELYRPGNDGLVNTADDILIGAPMQTSATGEYLFSNLLPGVYFVKANPLFNYRRTGGSPATSDNDVDNNNDGSQPGGAGTPLFSSLITLLPNTESITDGDTNPNTNLTVDFGLAPALDFGDFDGFGSAASTLSSQIYLGNNPPDDELTAVTNSAATGDDLNGIDDEDGLVSQGVIRSDQSGTITVRVSNGSATSAFLNGWVDWNRNGALETSERVINNITIAANTATVNQNRSFTVPAFTTPGTYPLRLRLSSTSNPGATTISGFGEVEDHFITVSPPNRDYGDFTNFGIASSTVNALLKLGPVAADAEIGSTRNSTATGDDITGTADEDGLVAQSPLHPGATGSITVNLSNGTTGGRFLNAWIDWNNNGTLELSERIATGSTHPVASGLNNHNMVLSFTVPANAVIGQVGTRLRLSNVSTAPATGFSGNGEIEDHLVQLTCPVITVTPGSLPNAVVGQPYSQTQPFTASGMATGAYLLSATSVPDGMSFNASAGTLQNAPTTAGLYNINVSATSTTHAVCTGSITVPFRVCPVINITPSTIPAIYLGQEVNTQLTATGGQAPYTWSIIAGALPDGVTLSSDGLLAGLPTEDGTTSFTIGVTDALGCLVSQAYTQTISSLTVGNLVFHDRNENGVAEAGEGLSGVTLQLFAAGSDPLLDAPIESTLTDADGHYYFDQLAIGDYFIFVRPEQFETGAPLSGLDPLSEQRPGDDHAGDDTLPTLNPNSTGVRSRQFSIAPGVLPTAASGEIGLASDYDDAYDSDADLTIDLGFIRGAGLGNLVFKDLNENGTADQGEGVAGVTLELYTPDQTPGFDTPRLTTTTAADGTYLFFPIRGGIYKIHLPASNFDQGAPLFETVSIAEGLAGDDDVGEDGINAINPTLTGITSRIVSVFPGTAPTGGSGETGFKADMDDHLDAAIDLTVDFGFQTPVGVGNLVFADLNENGVFDAGEGVGGVRVELFRADQSLESVPIFSQITRADGHFFFGGLGSGSYRLRIPGNQFQPGGALAGLLPLPHAPAGDDDLGQNGLHTEEPEAFGVVTEPFTLANNMAPTNADTETGFRKTDDDYDDNNFDLTHDFGFTAPATDRVSVGNLVFEDSNGDGRYTQGEGVPGVVVRLFSGDITDPAVATPIAETQTDADGLYHFRNLLEGNYFVHIPASQFSVGGPLAGRFSLAGNGEDNAVDDDGDENGIDSATPATTGIRSVVFNLAIGTEPTDLESESGKSAAIDNQLDENGDMTIDFGFFRPMSIGNLVFFDANNNGRSDLGEGVEAVEVHLFAATSDPLWDTPLAVTFTDEAGHYLFSGLTPGSYLVHLPASQFALGAPLHDTISLLGHSSGDDNTSEDGVDSAEPQWFGISSRQIDLIAGEAPVGSAESGLSGSSDDAEDAWVDLTIDFGFGSRTGVGNLVFIDSNDDGLYDPETEAGVPGVTLELWTANGEAPAATTSTDSDGRYQFNAPPGTYFINIPASEFQPGAVLAYHRSSTSNYLSSPATAGDDDVGEDGMDGEDPLIAGVRTPDFVLAVGTLPTVETTETGLFNGSDDATDANVDLTVDLGFTPVPLSVGNLVFRDLDNNGRFNGNDRGIPGLLLHLFRVGDNPATDNPIDSILTDSEGRYLLQTTVPGFYFVHITAQNFASGSQLEGALSSPGFGSDNGTDDDANEDGIDSANPAVTGINSIAFELAHGQLPIGPNGEGGTETGQFADSDDEYDYLTNLTIDFGFNGGVNGSLGAIGNLVFIDANNNGVFDTGEGVGNVDIHLYQAAYPPGTGTAIASTVTASNGTYLFGNLPSGEYIVYVEPSNFQIIRFKRRRFEVGPLAGRISILGTANGDDNAGEKGLDASSPGQTGVRTAAITLDLENAPLNEPGAFTTMNATFGDANTDLTADFGFRSPPQSPDAERTRNVLALGSADDASTETGDPEEANAGLIATYAQWAEQHQLGSTDAPADDADQDGLSNLLEYALGSNPLSGVQTHPALKLTTDASGQIIASFARPAAGLEDLRFQLQSAADFDGNWSPLSSPISSAILSDGRQEVQQSTQAESETAPPFGLVRLQVSLDSDGDGQPEASTLSPVSAWTKRDFPVGQQSLAMPLLRPAIFSGLISAAAGNQVSLALPAGTSIESLLAPSDAYYLEITQGTLAGHRFEINLTQSQGHQLILDLTDPANTAAKLPTALVGSRAAIRHHWTLTDLLPPAILTSGPDRLAADGALFFDRLTNSYLPLWLKAGETARWTDAQDSSASHHRIPAGAGLLLHLRHSPRTFTWTGEVRDHAFRLVLLPGSQLIASGYPNAVSPATLGLLPTSGLIAADQPSLADNLKLWLGDFQPGSAGYRNLFLKTATQAGLPATWSDPQFTENQDFTHSLLLPRGHALFFARQPAEPLLLIQTSPLLP